MKTFFDLQENLRKQIASNSGKFPEGSTVKCKKSGKTGKVLTVGKDFVKVAVGGKQIDYKPSELELVKEGVELDEKRKYKVTKKDKVRMVTKAELDTYKQMGWTLEESAKLSEAPEDDQPASPDEKGMAMDQAKFIKYVGDEIAEYLEKNNKFPEWMQNKLSALHQKSKDMHAVLAGKYEEQKESTKRGE